MPERAIRDCRRRQIEARLIHKRLKMPERAIRDCRRRQIEARLIHKRLKMPEREYRAVYTQTEGGGQAIGREAA
jgi:hypothetical protein